MLLCVGGGRRFCPPLFKVRVFDAPPVVIQLLLFVLNTGERRCELVEGVGIDVLAFPAAVVDEPLLSDGCNKRCEATKNKSNERLKNFDCVRLVGDEV